jgi:DNA-binding MarR family transcriptional regulator
MCLHPSTITGLIDRLEKKGYVERDGGREDRRVVILSLTSRGKELAREAPNPIREDDLRVKKTKEGRTKFNLSFDAEIG